MLGGVGDSDIATHIPKAGRATNGANHEQKASSQLVDQEEEPDESHASLDNTEDTSSKERGVGSGDADALEDRGRVVVDGVDSGGVLPEEESAAEEESVENLLVADEGSEWVAEAETDSRALKFECRVNLGNFFDEVDVVSGDVAEVLKVLDGFFSSPLAEEPTWRFLDEESSDEHETCRDELNGEGNHPLFCCWRHSGADTVVDPETDKATNLPTEFVKTHKSTSNSWRSHL